MLIEKEEEMKEQDMVLIDPFTISPRHFMLVSALMSFHLVESTGYDNLIKIPRDLAKKWKLRILDNKVQYQIKLKI